MKYLLGIIACFIFFWLLINQYFLYTIIFALVVAILFATQIYRGPTKVHIEDDDIYPIIDEENVNTVKPMVDEVTDDVGCILYKLDGTSKLQREIEMAVEFDNNVSLDNNNFKGLSDNEIKTLYNDGSKIWQYDDEFGIGDFKLDDNIKNDTIAVSARTNDGYKNIGYISSNDSKYVNDNRNNIKSIRLIYYGGYYKYVDSSHTVTTEYDNYVLTLAICYNKQ